MSGRKQQPLIPRLRFPEFRNAGPWEVKRLGDEDVAQFIRDRIPSENIPIGHYVSTVNLLPNFGGLAVEPEAPPPNNAVEYREGDILVSNIRPYLKKVWSADRSGGASNDVLVVRAGKSVVRAYLGHLLMSDRFITHVMEDAKGVKMPRGNLEQIQDFGVPVPPKPDEQQKIADCLTSLDDLIRAEEERLEALKAHKKGLMQQLFPAEGETTPRLRFPEFRNAGPWEVKKLSAALAYEQPGPFIVSTEQYGASGIPVLTPGKTFILGYTSEKHGMYERTPVIIFDDFTTESKYVDFPFKVKSSAIKILSARPGYSLKFVHEAMMLIKFDASQHKRYWIGEYQHLVIPFPSPKEQQKIADCLSSLDDLIRAEEERLEALKAHKKGLMQQLFPQEVD